MLSILRKGVIYNNISSDIVEHDLDVDADQWNYDEKDVYRGSVDPDYLCKGLNVYWLYDDNLKRVGLAEHEAKEPEVFKALWFYDNPFATLYQDPTWKSTQSTLWSKLSNEAYQDFLEGMDVQKEALKSGLLLVTPNMLIERPKLYTCERCGMISLMEKGSCPSASASDLDFSKFSILFLDEDYVIHERVTQPSDASVQEPSSEPDSLAAEESPDAHSPPPHEAPQSPP